MSSRSGSGDGTMTTTNGHWRAGVVLAMAAVGTGVVLGNTAVFLAAIVGLVYSGFTSLAAPPDPTLYVERTVTPASPRPGDDLSVTVTVENVGSGAIADVRIADQPPEGLEVVDGATHHGATLAPSETASVEYSLRARRGKYRFGDVATVSHAASGGATRRSVHEVRTEVTCYTPFDALDLAPQTGVGTGRVETDTGGEGVEFYATRQHHPSDSMRRIDWNRYASTGELTTVTYRESRSATVVFVVDGRHPVRRRAGEPDAVELSGYATVRIADALLDAQNSVGAAVFGDRGRSARYLTVDGALDPDRGPEQSIRIRELLRRELGVEVDDVDDRSTGGASSDGSAGEASGATAGNDHPSSTLGGGRQTVRSDGGGRTDWLRDHIPGGAQVVFVSPLLDSVATDIVTRLEAHGHALTVVSPAVTAPETPGGTHAHIERSMRLGDLRGDERVRVVDWSLDESLQAAVSRESAGWER